MWPDKRRSKIFAIIGVVFFILGWTLHPGVISFIMYFIGSFYFVMAVRYFLGKF